MIIGNPSCFAISLEYMGFDGPISFYYCHLGLWINDRFYGDWPYPVHLGVSVVAAERAVKSRGSDSVRVLDYMDLQDWNAYLFGSSEHKLQLLCGLPQEEVKGIDYCRLDTLINTGLWLGSKSPIIAYTLSGSERFAIKLLLWTTDTGSDIQYVPEREFYGVLESFALLVSDVMFRHKAEVADYMEWWERVPLTDIGG